MTETDADMPIPPPEPVQRRRRAAWILAAGLVVMIAIIVAGALLWTPFLMPLFSRGAPDTDLAARLDKLSAAQDALSRRVAAAAAADTAAQNALGRHVQALEQRPSAAPVDLSGLQQQIAKLGATVAKLGTKVDSLDQTVQALPKSAPREAALALVVLQIENAVRQAQPFTQAYDTFVALARGQADLLAAARPLAAPARTGIASEAALARELHELATRTAADTAPAAPAAPTGWHGWIVAQLHSLVRVRRVDNAGQSPAQATIAAAERAVAAGDLAGAVAAVQKLSGPDADRARPWLDSATARLRVEGALDQMSTLLAARLGTGTVAPSPPP